MNERKEQIADTFKKYFHHYGFKKTAVDEVASELRISKKTIYENFDSKEAVLAYIIQRDSHLQMLSINQTLSTCQSEKEKLETLIELIFDHARTFLINTQSLDFSHQEDLVFLIFQAAYEETLKQILMAGVNQGEFMGGVDPLGFSFIKALVHEGFEALKSNSMDRPELQTYQTILKIIS